MQEYSEVERIVRNTDIQDARHGYHCHAPMLSVAEDPLALPSGANLQ
jgi:hypothetical protein